MTTLKPGFLSVCTGSGSPFVSVISIIHLAQQGLCLWPSCTACSMYYIQIFQKTSVCPALSLRLPVTLHASRFPNEVGMAAEVSSSWQRRPNRHRCCSTTCPTNEIEMPTPTAQAPAVLRVSPESLTHTIGSRASSHHQQFKFPFCCSCFFPPPLFIDFSFFSAVLFFFFCFSYSTYAAALLL